MDISSIYRRVNETAKTDYQLRHVCLSVRPLALDGYSLNLIFQNFAKIRQENSGFIKI